MSRNTNDALCLGCKEPIRVLTLTPQYCKECWQALQEKEYLQALQEEADKLAQPKPD